MNKGLVHVFTGDGKGKTSAALGVSVRAVCAGMKVVVVQWYKTQDWNISEHKLPGFMDGIEVLPMGEGFYKLPTDKKDPKKHKDAAKKALKKSESLLGRVDVLVLDEINNAVHDGLLSIDAVVELMKKRGKTHLILTGRNVDKKITEVADLVTEMKKIKHPFDKGLKAVKGLDF
ncbi:cob(I)yrinic acid a,c-diamide adenosyltransferase [Patescibacteria group bacterium]